MRPNPASIWLRIDRKLEKKHWRHNLPTWRHRIFFWCCHISLVKFSYCSKFHVNTMVGSRVMTIFVYKGLTRKPEIRNTPEFCTNVSNKMLLNTAKMSGLQLLPSPNTQIRVKPKVILDCFCIKRGPKYPCFIWKTELIPVDCSVDCFQQKAMTLLLENAVWQFAIPIGYKILSEYLK